MAVTTYRTYNGRLRAEVTDGVRTTYLTDALGSVTATVDSSQTVLNTYRYKPSGDLLAKTGSSPDPRFLWTGDTGSRTTGLAYSEQYNRLRHYGSKQAAWTTVDPRWPKETAYNYCQSAPTRYLDPFGLDCAEIPLPIFKVLFSFLGDGLIDANVAVKVCSTVFDNTCCDKKPHSFRCDSGAISTTVKVELGFTQVFTLLKIIEKNPVAIGEQILQGLSMVMDMLVDALRQVPPDEKTCGPKPGRYLDVNFCVTVCAFAVGLEWCTGKGWRKLHYCGWPSIGGTLDIGSKVCV